MFCPAFGTAASRSRSAIGAHAGSVSAGRLTTGAGRGKGAGAGAVAEGEVPDLGRTGGQGESDEFRVVRFERTGFGVERDERRAAKAGRQFGKRAGIVHDDDPQIAIDALGEAGRRRGRPARAPDGCLGASPARVAAPSPSLRAKP